MPWPPDDLDALLSAGRPHRFSSGALARIPCLQSWSAASLASRGAAVPVQCWRQADPEFVLARGREAEFASSRSISLMNTTLGAFWAEQLPQAQAQASAAPDGRGGIPHLTYHSGPLGAWSDELMADGQPALDALRVSDRPDGVEPDSWPDSSINVWMGSAGVLATPHYDTSHNFVLQVVGTKEWRLWPPEQLPSLRMHPATHPSRRQSRLQLTAAGSAAGYANTSALGVEMRPGDVMYVPPFWAHGVLSTTAALSLSVLSPSWVEAVWARAKWAALPFGKLPPPTSRAGRSQRALAAGRLLRVLLPSALPGDDARGFCAAVSAARHDSVPGAAESDGGGPVDAGDVACTAQPEAEAEDSPQPTHAALLEASERIVSVLRLHERAGAGGSGHRRFEPSVARELLAGYVEDLAAWVLGAPSLGGVRGLLRCWAAGGAGAHL